MFSALANIYADIQKVINYLRVAS
ncbi:hypothetical protein NTGBS_560006 [Candidatus Nitrotoga sp. BS]|nr:hypothetical protein NTGBS_560006 [Candidatus Nitrotoga sp. BS]